MRRADIYQTQAEVRHISQYAGDTFVFKLHAPQLAQNAKAGQFLHVRCHQLLALRRPFSLLSANAQTGEIEILFKNIGTGTELLSQHQVGDVLNLLGPIGNGFSLLPDRPRALILGGGVGMPPVQFFARTLRSTGISSTLFLGSEIPFPFAEQTTELPMSGVSKQVNRVLPEAERLAIPSRLASLKNFAGCFRGYVTDLANDYLNSLSQREKSEYAIYACGPTPMLRSAATLAGAHQLPSQLCLEEFMACAVGGCAGCTIVTETKGVKKMQRVCVDGPVFDGSSVLF